MCTTARLQVGGVVVCVQQLCFGMGKLHTAAGLQVGGRRGCIYSSSTIQGEGCGCYVLKCVNSWTTDGGACGKGCTTA